MAKETQWFMYEHVNFNATHWKTKTEKEFLKHEAHHGLSETQLKEAWALMTKPPEEKIEDKK